mmetsp:Transcript_9454/g.11695  ORF Transcript_9454/g.11695 Transcript_9454/m.11695 type:complete len:86 (-) Transcript_9454:270-527(-)
MKRNSARYKTGVFVSGHLRAILKKPMVVIISRILSVKVSIVKLLQLTKKIAESLKWTMLYHALLNDADLKFRTEYVVSFNCALIS